MSNRTAALYKLSSVQFVALELHIYLDTHPGDVEAQKKYNEYMAAYKAMLKEFEATYGAISCPADSKEWLKDPWPWDVTKECDC